MIYSWDIKNEELEDFIKESRKRYLKSVLDKEIAEATYYEIIEYLIMRKLNERNISHGTLINISFAEGDCKCVFRGIHRGKIRFTEFTKKGKLGKTQKFTDWDMWENIQKIN